MDPCPVLPMFGSAFHAAFSGLVTLCLSAKGELTKLGSILAPKDGVVATLVSNDAEGARRACHQGFALRLLVLVDVVPALLLLLLLCARNRFGLAADVSVGGATSIEGGPGIFNALRITVILCFIASTNGLSTKRCNESSSVESECVVVLRDVFRLLAGVG
jgi:hypothetical protein